MKRVLASYLSTNSNKDEMLKVRSVITGKLSEYMQGEGYTLSQNSRYSHSLDSFLFTYTNSGGRPDVIKVEINYYEQYSIIALTILFEANPSP